MWNLDFEPPRVIEARVLTRLPDSFRRKRRTEWADANKPGHELDSFLEGPSFDRDGNLYVTDIPIGRIFRISPSLEWTLAAEYDGWPNGTAIHRDGSLWIADYRRGLLRLEFSSRTRDPMEVLGHRNSESFKGLNDLTFGADGSCYFTDQGQTGLHDATGRVYRLRPGGQLDGLLANVPSPNGIALDATGRIFSSRPRGRMPSGADRCSPTARRRRWALSARSSGRADPTAWRWTSTIGSSSPTPASAALSC
jgi:gluconolactonase